MELRHLRYFVAVAHEGNFTRAARSLRVAQPALSRQVRQLEEELDVTLLERDHRGARLTEAGRSFLVEAQAILEQSEKAIRRVQSRKESPAVIKVGYVWGLFHSTVPKALARFRASSPEVAVHLFDLTSTRQAEAIVAGRVDLGFIGFAHEADDAGLVKRKIGACRFVVALPKGHRLARRSRVPLSALARELFIAISEEQFPGAANVMIDACQKAGFQPRILQIAERGHAMLGMVAGKCGVALLPETLQALPHPGVVFRPATPSPLGDLYLAWDDAKGAAWRDRFVESVV